MKDEPSPGIDNLYENPPQQNIGDSWMISL